MGDQAKLYITSLSLKGKGRIEKKHKENECR
jgi:hypothetical protein